MQDIIAKLTTKDDKYACAIADKIISESQDTDEWYEYFNRLLDTYLYLQYNNRVEYSSPEAVYRSTVMPDQVSK